MVDVLVWVELRLADVAPLSGCLIVDSAVPWRRRGEAVLDNPPDFLYPVGLRGLYPQDGSVRLVALVPPVGAVHFLNGCEDVCFVNDFDVDVFCSFHRSVSILTVQ